MREDEELRENKVVVISLKAIASNQNLFFNLNRIFHKLAHKIDKCNSIEKPSSIFLRFSLPYHQKVIFP